MEFIAQQGHVRLYRDGERFFLRSASLNTGWRNSQSLTAKNGFRMVGPVYNVFIAFDRKNRMQEYNNVAELFAAQGEGLKRYVFQQADCERKENEPRNT